MNRKGSDCRRVVAILGPLLGFAIVSGCLPSELAGLTPTASIRARKDSSFVGRVSRLLVFVPRSDQPDEDGFFRIFIEKELNRRKIAALAVVVTEGVDLPGRMQSRELAAKRSAIDTLAPDAILDIRTKNVVRETRRHEWRVRIVYEASLYPTPLETSRARIWRAELEHTGPELGMEGRFQLAAKRLVDRIDRDGLLTANSAVP